jgi:hypothetical protein
MIVKVFDFADRVLIKCLLEGVFVGIFSFLAMLAASIDGICATVARLSREKRNDTG